MENNYDQYQGKGYLVVEGWDLPLRRHYVRGLFMDYVAAVAYAADEYDVQEIFDCNVAIVRQDNEGNREMYVP